MAALTACNASLILGKGKESWMVIALRALKSIHKQISPDFFMDNDYLRCVQTS